MTEPEYLNPDQCRAVMKRQSDGTKFYCLNDIHDETVKHDFLKSALEIHNEMYEQYRKDIESVGTMTSDEVYKIAPEITPLPKFKSRGKERQTDSAR